MKRFLVFTLLGPPIGALSLIAPLVLSGGGDPNVIADLVLVAYRVGIAAAIVAGLADGLFKMWDWTPFFRASATGLIGVIATTLSIFAFADWAGGSAGRDVLYGLGGFVPGAVCSWISSRAD
jgi:hypothetical protein